MDIYRKLFKEYRYNDESAKMTVSAIMILVNNGAGDSFTGIADTLNDCFEKFYNEHLSEEEIEKLKKENPLFDLAEKVFAESWNSLEYAGNVEMYDEDIDTLEIEAKVLNKNKIVVVYKWDVRLIGISGWVFRGDEWNGPESDDNSEELMMHIEKNVGSDLKRYLDSDDVRGLEKETKIKINFGLDLEVE